MRFNKIYVEITNICNLNCSFCSKDNRKPTELTLEQFETILKKIKNYTKTIYLHIKGEPLIHSNFENILDLTKQYDFKVKITTNGTLLKERYHILKKYNNIKQINISLHSENNKENYFDEVFKYATLLSEEIPIVYRIWNLNNFKLNKLSTNIVDKIIYYYKLNSKIKINILNNKNIKIQNNIYLDKDNQFIWPTNTSKSNNFIGSCLGTKTHIGILSNGDVVPCCLDSSALLKLGNIFVDDLNDIINSQIFYNINNGFKNNKLNYRLCQNCNFRKIKSL